jgi:integrase
MSAASQSSMNSFRNVVAPMQPAQKPATGTASQPTRTPTATQHESASLLIAAGESVKVVQERLGHASASETLDTYSRLRPSSDEHMRSAVDEALGLPIRNSQVRPAADLRA